MGNAAANIILLLTAILLALGMMIGDGTASYMGRNPKHSGAIRGQSWVKGGNESRGNAENVEKQQDFTGPGEAWGDV